MAVPHIVVTAVMRRSICCRVIEFLYEVNLEQLRTETTQKGSQNNGERKLRTELVFNREIKTIEQYIQNMTWAAKLSDSSLLP